MKKLIASLLSLVALGLAVPAVVGAQTVTVTTTTTVTTSTISGGTTMASTDSGTTLRHAYAPVLVSNGGLRARVDNFAPMPVSTLVCVEAWNVANGMKTHLGCLTVNLDSFMGANNWAAEFDAPVYLLAPGTYNIKYTYRGTDGSWNLVKMVTLQVPTITYMK